MGAGSGPGPMTSRYGKIPPRVRLYQVANPRVIIHAPDETATGLWEVTLPASACIAFEDDEVMLETLKFVTIPEDDEEKTTS